jgi:hypothetical protein
MPKFAPNVSGTRKLFYSSVVDEAELIGALEIEGIDEELALLRIQLKNLVHERKDDLPLVLKGFDLLARTAAVRYRMSAKSRDELAQSLGDTIMHIAGQLFPERCADV